MEGTPVTKYRVVIVTTTHVEEIQVAAETGLDAIIDVLERVTPRELIAVMPTVIK
jgi:hypothetical protein